MDSSGPGEEPLSSSCEWGYEFPGPIKRRDFFFFKLAANILASDEALRSVKK